MPLSSAGHPARWLRRVILGCSLLALTAPVGAQAPDQPSPAPTPAEAQALLAGRGLKRVGNLFLLEAEVATRAQLQNMQRTLIARTTELNNLGTALQQAQTQFGNAQNTVRNLQNQREQLNLYLAQNGGDPTNFNYQRAQNQLQALVDELRLANNRMATLEQNAQNYTVRAATLQDQVAQLRQEFQTAVDQLEVQYKQIAQDSEVFEAIKIINHKGRPWVTLGPEHDSKRKLAVLAERVLNEAGFQVDPKKKSITATGEAEFNRACHQAWVLGQKLKGREADASRRKLAELVPTLRPQAQAIDRIYKGMARDNTVADATAEYAAATGLRVRAGASAEFTKNLARLPEFERLVPSAGGAAESAAGSRGR